MVQLLQNLADEFADFAQGMVRRNPLLRLNVQEHPALILKPSAHLQSSRRIREEHPFALARFFSKLLALLGAKTTLTTAAGSSFICGGPIFSSCSGTNRQLGAALGGGLEYGLTPNLSAKLEYLYITAVSLEISRHSEIRAGLNYRFGGL
jgi:hypothetical protein